MEREAAWQRQKGESETATGDARTLRSVSVFLTGHGGASLPRLVVATWDIRREI